MKCSFCGNIVPDGSELCPSCGMILGLGDDLEQEVSIPEYTPNVFGSEPIVAPEADPAPAVVAPAAKDEPEVFEAPAYEATSTVPEMIEEPVYDETPASAEEYEVPAYDETPAEPEIYEAPAYDETFVSPVTNEELPEDIEEHAEPDVSAAEFEDDDTSYPEYEAFVDDEEEQAIVDDILNDENEDEEIAVPVVIPENEEAPADEEEYDEVDDDSDDTYIKSGKKGTGTIVSLCVLLVCLIVAGVYVFNQLSPDRGTTTTGSTLSDSANVNAETDDTDITDEETTEDNSSAEADDEQTTTADSTTDKEEVTTADSTEADKNTTKEQSTTYYTTTQRQTTTKYTTTTRRYTTTKKQTTTKRTTTTKPATTKPSTTKPTTTDPYGINDVTLQKPSQYLSKTYHAYVTVGSVKMRAKPSDSSDRVQYLSKGAEVIVYAKQNGFCYVYSTRFGTYGWISASYLSDSRPVESTTSVKKNTVSPDVNGSGETKYTTNTLNLRKGPSTDYDVIKTVPINYPVKIVGYKSGVSGWAYVTDLTSGNNGWVSTAYLK